MNGPEFLDTNVLVYAYERDASAKRDTALDLVRRALDGEFLVSTQVLAEFASTLLHKFRPTANPKDVEAVLDTLGPIRVVSTDAGIVRRAVEARSRYGIHFYDGMIVAAAERAGCTRIWSEDLNPRQNYFGIAVENPFAVKPPRRSRP
jgi:predicted nucleic acid-binding protein